jgi:hypothetical protein
MNQRSTPQSAPSWLIVAIAILVGALVVVGTINPWPVAAAKLGDIGPGPYIPLSYSYRSSTTSEFRSQNYLVVSQIGKSLSTYRVEEDNGVATVREVRYGFLYGLVFLALFLGSLVWALLSARSGRASKTDA